MTLTHEANPREIYFILVYLTVLTELTNAS